MRWLQGKKEREKPHGNILSSQSSWCSLEVRSKEIEKGGRREIFYKGWGARVRKYPIYFFIFNLCVNYHSSVQSGTAGSYHFCQGLMVMVGEVKVRLMGSQRETGSGTCRGALLARFRSRARLPLVVLCCAGRRCLQPHGLCSWHWAMSPAVAVGLKSSISAEMEWGCSTYGYFHATLHSNTR